MIEIKERRDYPSRCTRDHAICQFYVSDNTFINGKHYKSFTNDHLRRYYDDHEADKKAI